MANVEREKRRRSWGWKGRRKRRARRWERIAAVERLEERVLLAGETPTGWGLPVDGTPVDVAVGRVDRDGWDDLLSLSGDGRLTVAINGGAGSWSRTVVSDLGLDESATAHGLTLGLMDEDSLLDAVVQYSGGIAVARGDGTGRFTPLGTWQPAVAPTLAPSDGGRVGLAATLADEDFATDLLAVSPQTDQVLVFLGGFRASGFRAPTGTGLLDEPARYASGGREPVDVVVGQFVGNALPDLAVGHRDGTVTFLAGTGGGAFELQNEATVGGLGTIQDLAVGDLDEDGDLDVAVSGGSSVTVLWQDDDVLAASPLVNGDFGSSLTGWTTEVSPVDSQDADAVPGSVSALGGFAQLWEHGSFLTSLQQTFTVPPSPQTISFDVVALGLEPAAGGIPDAFEVSLLNEAGQSLVPAFRPEATTFLNIGPEGDGGAEGIGDGSDGNNGSYGAGVRWDGRRVTLDIASLVPGTRATLIFDLVGNPPGASSVVGIDNVRIEPDTLPRETFTPVQLSGTFQASAGIAAGDVDGDGHGDLVVADAAADRVVTLSGDGDGAFVREERDVSLLGHRPGAVALGMLTPQDVAWDAVIALAGSGSVLAPLDFHAIPPQVTLVQPAPSQTALAAVSQIALQFSEAMRDAGPAGEHSVTNPAAYRLYTAGENGLFEAGGGDDELVAWERIVYDATTHAVTIGPVAGELPDGCYEFRVAGGGSPSAPVDLTGNALDGGNDVTFSFAVNVAGPVDLQAAELAGSEGRAVTLLATFANPGSSGPHTAVVDWGDGSSEAAVVLLGEDGQRPFSVTAEHVYADDGSYTVRVEIADESLGSNENDGNDGSYASLEVLAVIANAAPTLTVSAGTVRHVGLGVTLEVGTFTDPGFSNTAVGTDETFTANIDWGDGTAASAGVVTWMPGWVGQPTVGTVQGTHTYAADGTYTVSVTVVDDDGGSDQQTFTLEVSSAESARFFVIDAWDQEAYRYTLQFVPERGWDLAWGNFLPQGVEANPAGDTLWVVGLTRDVFVYDAGGTVLGSWRASDVRLPGGIATDGQHLWIVDAFLGRVLFYADAAAVRSGRWTATSSFDLHSDNRLPTGLTSDGHLLWVTDVSWCGSRVFVYTVSGELVGSWPLDSANSIPSGITLDRASGDLWVVDWWDAAAYRYAGAAAWTNSSQPASQVNPLTAGNRFPTGIADPATWIQIGDTVSETISEPGQTDVYSFSAAAGQTVFLDFQSLSGGPLLTELFGPAGQTVYSASNLLTDKLDSGPLVLTAAGTYTLEVKSDGTSTPAYRFRLWEVPATAVHETLIGTLNQGLIPSPGAAEEWRFEATAGQSIYIDFQPTGGNATLQTRLLGPDGSEVYTESDFVGDALDRGPLTLAAGGTYTLCVSGFGDDTSGYAFQVWDVPPADVQEIPLNTPITGQTTSAVDRVEYRFEAQADEEILIDLIDNPAQVYFALKRPSGGWIFQWQTGDQLLAALPESGTYTLIASSYKPGTQVISDHYGAFRFQVQQVAAPALGVPDSRGTDFWLAFTRHQRDPLGEKDAELVLQISSDVDTSGTVMIPGWGLSPFRTSFVVRAGQVTRITLPDSAEITSSDQVEPRGVHVRALDEVSVYALSYLSYGTDGFLALPSDTFGREFVVVSYGEGDAQTGRTSSFGLVAAENGTTVTITPSVSVGSHAAGVPYSLSLNAGQVYELTTDTVADLTGTRVVADKPIGAYGGHRAARVPAGYQAANYLVEQLPPLDTWGRRFVTLPLATRQGGDRFRIVAAWDGTEVRINGTLAATLGAGQFHETVLTQAAEITASQPILVAQLAHSTTYDNVTGDPTLLLVPPVEQYLDRYTLSAPLTGFDVNYVNVVAPTAAVGAITLDGAAISADRFTPIGTSGYSGAQLPVPPGTHHLATSSLPLHPSSFIPHPSPFGVFAYGFAEDDAYGYLGGQAFGRINAVTNFELTPETASQSVGNQQVFVATLSDGASQPLPGVRVDFSIAGTHASSGFAVTDGLGRAVLTLTGSRPGLDTVTASAGQWSDTAVVTWTAPTPTVAVTAPESGSQLCSGSYAVLLGRATPGVPTAPVVAVTVNGRPVDALDAGGNFFALVQVAAGVNALTVEATDAFGQSGAASLTLIGVEPATGQFAFDQARDATAAGQLTFAGTFFNRQSHTLHAEMRLTNAGDDSLRASVLAVFAQISPPAVVLSEKRGQDSFPVVNPQVPPDRPYLTFDAVSFDGESLSPSGVLLPAETSLPIAVRFDNPQHLRFGVDVTLLAAGNRPPRFETAPLSEAAAGRPYRYAAAASDADGDTVTYRLAAGPGFLSVDSHTGLVTGTPGADDVGTYQVELAADDGFGGTALQSYQLQVWAAIPNRPPRFVTAPGVQAEPGADYAYAARADDLDGGALRYTLDAAPPGMTVDETTGVVRYPQAAEGAHTVSLRADDGRGGVAEQVFVLSVGSGESNISPQFESSPPVRGVVGQLYLYPAAATDPDGDTPQFVLTQAPAGMTVDAATGVVRWEPAAGQTGLQPVTLRVDDRRGGASVQRWLIDVTSTAINRPPLFVGRVANPSLTQDVPFTQTLTAQDPEAQGVRYELTSGPPAMTVHPQTGLLSWTPTAADLGWHRVVVRAYDPLDAFAQQTFYVEVRPPNTPPRFTRDPLTTGVAGAVYRDLITAADAEDAFTFSVLAGPAGMTIDAASGLLFWHSTPADVGPHGVTLRVTDDRGLWADQQYTLHLMADAEPPAVSVLLSDDLILLETTPTVSVRVSAIDNVAVTGVTLSLGNTPLPPEAVHSYEFTPPGPGLYHFTATATDAAGNVGTATRTLRVFDPADTTPPVVDLTSPAAGDVITYLTNVIGTASDENLEFYRLEYALAGTDQWVTFYDSASSCGTPYPEGGLTNSLLGVLDPTLLQRDAYDLRVVAQDINGQMSIAQLGLPISVEAEAVLGNFRLDFTDLTIPLAGISIQIHRTYDTLNAGRSGDFGFGWQLNIAQANLRETVRVTDAERSGIAALFAANPFRQGTRVYLTTPAGRRVGFTFDPEPEGGVLGTIWHPRFTPDPGIYDTLTVEDTPLSQRPDGTYTHYLVNLPYNPDQYELTVREGTSCCSAGSTSCTETASLSGCCGEQDCCCQSSAGGLTYRYDQFVGLLSVTDRNGTALSFTDEGVVSSIGESIRWVRDLQGRITEIIDPAGTSIRYAYDAAGDLVSVTDQAGNVTSLTYLNSPAHYLEQLLDPRGNVVSRTAYDDAGRVAAVYDAFGQAVTQSFDPQNNREVVADRLGNEMVLVYDERGNIVSQTNPLGGVRTFSYDEQDNVTAATDPLGFTTHYAYDDRGNLTAETDALGNTWQITYNADNQPTSWTDPLGHSMTMTYDQTGNLVEYVDLAGNHISFELDSLGRPVRYIDGDGQETSYSYSPTALPTKVTHADGSVRQVQYNQFQQMERLIDENGNATQILYNAIGLPVLLRDAQGHEWRYDYDATLLVGVTDPLGRQLRFEYDAAGRRVREIDRDGSIWEFRYDANGNLLEEISPSGYSTQYVYDALGRVSQIVDPLGQVTRREYDEVGNLFRETDKNGNTTQHAYDELGQRVEILDPLGGVLTMEYDAGGNLVRRIDPLGNVTAYEYDGLSRLTATIDALGGVTQRRYDGRGNVVWERDPTGSVTQFAYDSRNRLSRMIDPAGAVTSYAYDPVGNRISTADAAGNASYSAYDELNRLIEITDRLGGRTRYSYDAVGNLTQVIDPLGRTQQYTYDPLDRPLTSTDALDATESLAWDWEGNRIQVTDTLGQTTRYEYDALGREIRQIDPLGNVRQTRYDAMDNVLEITDKNGRVRSFEYDPLDRLTTEQWWDVGNLVQTIETTYDAVGNIVSVEDAFSPYHVTYDDLYRVASQDNLGTPNSPAMTLAYTYDAAGRVLSVSDGLGTRVDSSYDPRGLLLSRTWDGGEVDPVRVEFTYDLLGSRTEIRRYAGSAAASLVGRTTFAYDAAERLTDLTHSNAVDAVLADYDFVRDLADQLTAVQHHGQSTTYQYDLTGQLIRADHSGQADEQYEYDANGNRAGGGYVAGDNNQIVSDGTFRYEHDREGNLVRKTEIAGGAVTQYTYDHRNRLVQVRQQSAGGILLGEVTYTYDAFDRRIAQSVDADGAGPQAAVVTYFVYDGDQAWADFDGQGRLLAAYLYGAGIDELVARYRPSQGTAWYLTDHLGTVRDIVDAVGQVIDRIDYDSFGNVTAESSPAAGDRFKFTGRELDAVTGLYYYRARYYDPRLGRFLSPDPLQFDAGDGNLYRYVGNAPLTQTDPQGLTAAVEYGKKTSAVTLQLIRQKFTCIAEGLATSLPEIILTGGTYAATDLAGEVVSCALLPVTAQANKAFTKLILWMEMKSPGGARKVVRLVLQGGKGLSMFAIKAHMMCSGQQDAAGAGSAMNGPNSLRDGLSGIGSGQDAHHIAAKRSRFAKRAREILAGCCIGINDAINGVALDRKVHQKGKLHTKRNYNSVDGLLEEAAKESCTAVFNKLKEIGGQYKNM